MNASTRWPRAVFFIVGMAACASGGEGPATSVESAELATLPRNGLLPAALAALAAPETRDFLPTITGIPLSTYALRPYEERIGNSEALQDVMEYIVSCALDPGVQVEVAGEKWPGELGLCGASSPFGSWGTATPTAACLEVVSSCVLARLNVRGDDVVISFRGEPNWHFSLKSEVPVEKAYRSADDPPIQSFEECPAGTVPGATSRNCGWSARFVGSCTPDLTVKLGVPAETMLRLCRGIHGCDHLPAREPPWYSGIIGSYDAALGSVEFTCPRNGVSPRDRSYFAVMLASSVSAVAPDGGDVWLAHGAGTYHALEKEVFTYREGAFFGNIFAPRSPNKPPPSQDAALIDEQYACYSEVWDVGIAALANRLCAGPDSPCIANPPRACLFEPRDPDTVAEPRSCSGESAGEQQDYFDCKGGTNPQVWTHPITVFLNHPCDLASDIPDCGKAYPEVLSPNHW